MLLGYFFSYINHRFLLKNKICKPFWNNKANLTIYQIIYQNPCWWLLDYVNVGIVVQLLSCGWLFAIPWTTACQASLSFTISQSLFKLVSIESMTPSIHLILCRPLLLLLSIFTSIRVFSVRQLFPSGGQSIRALASASVLPMNIQDWFPLGLTGLISTDLQ